MPRLLSAALVLFAIAIPLSAAEKLSFKRQDIDARGLTLKELLGRLPEDWKNNISYSPDLAAEAKLNVQLKGATFWQVVDAVAEAAGARVYLFQGDGKVHLARRDKVPQQPVSHSGLFRVALKKITTSHDFETGARNCVAILDVAWEPTFQPFYLETRPRDLQLRDAAGKPLASPATGGIWAAVDGRIALPVEQSLPALPRSAEKIGLIKGSFQVRGPTQMLTFKFDSLDQLAKAANAPQQKQSGVTCSLTSIKLRARAWTVQVTAVLPEGGAEFESFQSWDVNNQIYLRHRGSREEKRLLPTGYDRVTTGSRRAVVNYHFEDTPLVKLGEAKDWDVVFRCPASIVEVPIPFEFKDVVLP